ncbi:hypothetical protein FRC10_007905 [Ceratobasidium sp. 414]|nr:hypothetical protein FRC10_007905 [Ceratobasidium sp. 414]
MLRPQQDSKKTALILRCISLLGRSKSGKTFFVKTACAKDERIDSKSIKSTVEITTQAVQLADKRFQFVDTPGFGHSSMSDLDVFTKLADYLLTWLRAGIAGIVYIHRAGDPLEGANLAQNLSVLFDVFLGDSGLSRLTIMVVPGKSGTQAPYSVAQDLSRASGFRTALAKGARAVVSTLRQTDIDNILTSCASLDPVLLRVQQESIRNLRAAITTQIKGRLDRSTKLRGDAQANLNLSTYDELESTLKEKERQVLELSRAHEQIEQQLARSQEETLALGQQLQQTRKEYVSLRSQLQLHENTEQSNIVQALKDLNRSIDDLARSISQYMVDTHSEAVFGKETTDVTSLNALCLPELKMLFGHVEGNSSLVASSDGRGMPIEDFLDYATRSSLCKHLFEAIFSPFHPAADSAHNTIVATIYDNVRRQEPQPVAAKWRASCFKNIHKPENTDAITHRVNLIVQQFVDNSLSPLLTYIFGETAGVELESQHLERILQLFRTAWDWNSTLKGDVIMLGDFHLTYYAHLCRFDGNSMREFEPDPHKPPPNHILGTLGLGLQSSNAVGGGQEPEIIVVLGATVATESLYA